MSHPIFTIFLLLQSPPSNSEITDITLTADTRPLILLSQFAFSSPNSTLSITTLHRRHVDPTTSSFLLIPTSHLLLLLDATSSCVSDCPFVHLLFTLRPDSPPRFTHTSPVPSSLDLSLLLSNCARSPVTISITVDAHSTNSYLSDYDAPLPTVYLLCSLCYLPLVWFYLKSGRSGIHRIMSWLLVVKAVGLVFDAEDRYYVGVTGRSHRVDWVYGVVQLVKGVLVVTVIVLVGTGWSFLKPFLQEREKRILMLVIPLQVITNVASVVIGDTGPSSWRHVFLTVDFICCFLILSPIVWSIRSLKETAKCDGKAAQNLAKLIAFRKFYIAVIGYLYFTRVVTIVIRTVLSIKYKWVSVAVEEAVSLAFYGFVFYMFRPKDGNRYFVLDEDMDEEKAMIALKEEGFEL